MSEVESTNWSYNEQSKAVSKRNVQLGDLKEGNIRIKISYFAVITTDIFAKVSTEEGTSGTHIACLGSQAVGHVTAVGPHEGRFKIGDRVAVGMYRLACGACRECHKNRDDLCKKSEFTSNSNAGGYATYIDANSDWAYPVPASIPEEDVPALVSDGSAIYSALKRHANPKDTVGIIGSKAAGQLALAYAKAMKYDTTVLGDAEDKQAIEALGGNFSELAANKSKYNVVLICTTSIDSQLYNKALTSTKMGGRLVVVGHPIQGDIRFGFFSFVGSTLFNYLR